MSVSKLTVNLGNEYAIRNTELVTFFILIKTHVGALNEKTYQPAGRVPLFEKNFDYIVARYANEGKDRRYCAPRNINLRENVCRLRPRNAGRH
jgi:hypothetical protein